MNDTEEAARHLFAAAAEDIPPGIDLLHGVQARCRPDGGAELPGQFGDECARREVAGQLHRRVRPGAAGRRRDEQLRPPDPLCRQLHIPARNPRLAEGVPPLAVTASPDMCP
jgi:hypothetical protein